MKKLSFIFLALLFVFSLFPLLITSYSFDRQISDSLLQSPSIKHWLGTDELGRDMLARILFGARISLGCALLSTLISGIVGVFYGSLAGFKGGWIDSMLMRFLDMLYSIPDLLFYILLGLFVGRSFWGMMITLSALGWVTIARLTRGEILKYKEMAYVEGANALGMRSSRILIKHILPQLKPTIKTALLLRIPSVILAESTLSFIGLGLKPPYSSWGTLASEGYGALQFYPHLILIPSAFICLTILSFQILSRNSQE